MLVLENFKKWVASRISSSPKTTGWFVFFLSLFLTMYLSYTEYQLNLSVEREEVVYKLNELENRFYSALNNGVSAVKTLGFFAQNHENIVADFENIGKEILESNPLVDVIQILDSGTIAAVYPLAGNEVVLGYDVLADPTKNKEVLEAIRRKDVFFSGPIHLKQGGIGIVGRYPLFRNGELQGLSAIIIYVDTIFKNGLLKDDLDGKFSIQLSKNNPNSGELENYLPTSNESEPTGFSASTPIDVGNWVLTVQLIKSTAFSKVLFAIFLRILLSVALGYVAWSFARQPALLRIKVAEQSKEILKANERFEFATRATSDVIWDWDLSSNQVYRSEQFSTMFGYGEDETVRNSNFWRSIIHPEDWPSVEKELDKTLKGADQFWQMEFRVRKADNTYSFITDKGYILRDTDGKPYRMIGAIQDISLRKANELKILQANQKLSNANEELKVFASLASHDMREPLRMISSFMSLLEKKYAANLDEKGRQYISFAMDGAKRLTLLINDLLEYSKVGFDRNLIEEINTKAIVREVLELKSDLIRENDATLIIGDLPNVMGVKIPMKILFQNLIGNALKYKKPDIKPEIKISGKELKDFWEFSIEDNGIGIEADYLDLIFGILKRLHPKEKYAGTGMGLATCRKIITQHEGKIWAESTPGLGSKFSFTIKKHAQSTY